jgi:transcriptional regulator with XRE-family HTH domain
MGKRATQTERDDFAKSLQALRKQHSMSQDAIAQLAGVTRAAVSLWEKAETAPDAETRKRVLDILNGLTQLGHRNNFRDTFRSVRMSKALWTALQKDAAPFVDTPETVIWRWGIEAGKIDKDYACKSLPPKTAQRLGVSLGDEE